MAGLRNKRFLDFLRHLNLPFRPSWLTKCKFSLFSSPPQPAFPPQLAYEMRVFSNPFATLADFSNPAGLRNVSFLFSLRHLTRLFSPDGLTKCKFSLFSSPPQPAFQPRRAYEMQVFSNPFATSAGLSAPAGLRNARFL